VRAARCCRLCGGSLAHHRADARFCSDPCRREGRRLARILAGETVDGYPSLAHRFAAFRSRAKRSWTDFTTAAREEALIEHFKREFDAVELPIPADREVAEG
jgi:hypothetical protein